MDGVEHGLIKLGETSFERLLSRLPPREGRLRLRFSETGAEPLLPAEGDGEIFPFSPASGTRSCASAPANAPELELEMDNGDRKPLTCN